MKINLKKTLLAGTAVVAFGSVGAFPAHAVTELTSAVAITATDATGVTETGNTNTVSVDTNGAGITLGVDATPSVIMNSTGDTLTINVENSGTNNALTFADDIVETAGNIVINIVDDTPVVFQGDVSASPISVGSTSADVTTLLTVDTANNENIAFDGTIVAKDAGDTVNLTITNTDGSANTVVFSGALGGSSTSTALDTIEVGDDTTDPMDVTFGGSVNATAISIGGANAANATNNVRFGTDGATSTVTGTIAGLGAGDTNAVSVVGGSTVTFVTGFGSNVDTIALGADASDTTVTFKGAVASGAVTLGAGAGTADTNVLTLDTTAGAFAVTPAIAGGNAADDNTLLVTGGNVATVTGAISVLDTVTLSGTGTGLTTGTTLAATNINVGSGTTLTTGGVVTGAVNLTGTGTVALGAGVTGAIDNTTGTDGRGTLTTSAGTFSVSSNVGATNSLAAVTNSGAGTMTLAGTTDATTITQSGAGEIEFTGDATATSFVASSTGTLDFNGNATGNVKFSADGVVTLADAKDLTGYVNNTSGADGAGTLTLEGDNTVSGNVGATNTLKKINAGATGKTAAFSGTVEADDIDFSADGDITFAGDVTVTNNIDFVDAAGTATFADGADFTGDIEDTSDDKGTVVFSGASTVTGNLGQAGSSLDVVNFNGATGKAVTVSGGVDVAGDIGVGGAGSTTIAGQVTVADDLLFTADGSISFADGLVAITDDVDTGTDSLGTVVFAGAGTVGGDFADDTRELKALTLTGTAKTVAITGAFEAADTTTVGYNTITAGGIFDADANQTLSFTIAGDTEYGVINSTGNAAIDADTNIAIEVNTSEYIASGTVYTLVDGAAGAGVADLNAGKITDDSVLFSFAQDTTDDANLDVTATRVAMNTVTTTGNNTSVGNMLDALGANGDANMDALQGAVQGAATADALNEVLESLGPTVDGGFVTGGVQATNLAVDATNMRLASARSGDETGMVAGEIGSGVTVWGKAFGQTADQDRRDGIDGYNADTLGFAAGVDSENVINNGLVGASFSYANTDVDSDNSNNTESDINSYQFSVYGGYDYGNDIYANAMLGYGHNKIDQTRYNIGGIAGNNANADFDSNQILAYAEVGKDYMVDSQLTLTPHVLANYQHVSFDNYTETGSTGNLSVDLDNVSILELGVGVTAEWELKDSAGNSVRPSLGAGYRYDVIGDNVQSTSTFTGGGAAFSSQGADVAQSAFNIGAGLAYDVNNSWELSADYDYQAKSDFAAHSASVRAGYKF